MSDTKFKVGAAPAETAGEMTAEQFWAKWANENFGKYPDRQLPEMYLIEFAEAFAKQRVEQAERKIANQEENIQHWCAGRLQT